MASATDTVSLDQIRRAREVVADVARETPVIESRYLSRTSGGTIALKAENLQRTGSFKLRGGLAAGIAAALKGSGAEVEVIGVAAHCAIADGIAVKEPGAVTKPLLDRF